MTLLLRRLLLLRLSASHRKRLGLRRFAGVLLTLFHLLPKLLGLLFVRETQPCQTASPSSIIQFKGVKEGAILVPSPILVDFLVPDDALICRRDVDQFDPKCVAHQIVCKHGGALQARIGPSRAVGICNVQLSDGNRLDLVGGFRHGALDRLLVLLCQD